MRIVFAALALFLFSNASLANAQESDEEKIKALIPAATALSEDEWRQVLTNATLPGTNQGCLTAVLFSIKPPGIQDSDENRREEFQYLTGRGNIVEPTILGQEVARGEYRTLVKADRVTGFTCEPGLEFYKGIVDFEVPELYRGRFHYKAIEMDAGWTITEIAMPAYKILIKCNGEGQWERVDDASKSDEIGSGKTTDQDALPEFGSDPLQLSRVFQFETRTR